MSRFTVFSGELLEPGGRFCTFSTLTAPWELKARHYWINTAVVVSLRTGPASVQRVPSMAAPRKLCVSP